MKRLVSFFLFNFIVIFLFSCHVNSKTTNLPSKPVIVATFSVLGDLTRELAGEHFEVVTSVSADADAHEYEPKSDDVKNVKSAKLVIANGLGLERWLDKLLESADYRGELLIVSKKISTRKFIDDGTEITDPHVWQNVQNVVIVVEQIGKSLAALDPKNASEYSEKTTAYQKKLNDLDLWIKEQMATVPLSKRRVITTHDAFGYYGDAYGVSFIAPEKWSTAIEVSAQSLARLISQVKREKTKALFIENMTDPRLMEQISREVGAFPSTHRLYSDALSKKEEGVDTYLKMMRNNTAALIEGMLKN